MTAAEALEMFYRADERRRNSPEVDYGVWWRDGRSRVPWRISWVAVTGELYAFRLGGDGDGSTVLVLTTIPLRADVERVLDGWADVCGQPDSLGWVRERVTGAADDRR